MYNLELINNKLIKLRYLKDDTTNREQTEKFGGSRVSDDKLCVGNTRGMHK